MVNVRKRLMVLGLLVLALGSSMRAQAETKAGDNCFSHYDADLGGYVIT